LSGEYLFLSLFLFSLFSLGIYRVFFHSLRYTEKKNIKHDYTKLQEETKLVHMNVDLRLLAQHEKIKHQRHTTSESMVANRIIAMTSKRM
jgi:hypothetical protein